MIQSTNEKWQKISELNNLKFEYQYLNGDIPVLVAQDYFKYPDLVRQFLDEGHWWTNGCNDMENIIRPGMSYYVHPEIGDFFGLPLAKPIASLLGLKSINIRSTNGNCFSSDMKLVHAESAFPHTDTMSDDYDDTCMIAYNINLTKSPNVKTGFWSFNGKKTRLDFSWNDQSTEQTFIQEIREQCTPDSSWFQIKDYGPWKLESIHTMCYNSYAAYPAHFFHNPYIELEWFTNTQRVTLAGFLDLKLSDLDFEDKNLETVCYSWEFLHLNKVLNFHPENTKSI